MSGRRERLKRRAYRLARELQEEELRKWGQEKDAQHRRWKEAGHEKR